MGLAAVIDSVQVSNDNGGDMQSLDIQNPGMPDLQFVLFVSALCTANLKTINVSEDLRRTMFDRCWALTHTEAPPAKPLIDRLAQLYPDDPDLVDPQQRPPTGQS